MNHHAIDQLTSTRIYCGTLNICTLMFINAVSAAEVMQSGIRHGLSMKSELETTWFFGISQQRKKFGKLNI
jgi:hypothetical protein